MCGRAGPRGSKWNRRESSSRKAGKIRAKIGAKIGANPRKVGVARQVLRCGMDRGVAQRVCIARLRLPPPKGPMSAPMLRAELADHNMIIFMVTINECYGGGVLSAAAKKHFKSSARAAHVRAVGGRRGRRVASFVRAAHARAAPAVNSCRRILVGVRLQHHVRGAARLGQRAAGFLRVEDRAPPRLHLLRHHRPEDRVAARRIADAARARRQRRSDRRARTSARC